ncbi:MAG TPA: cytochrome c [Bryobacteraceae bacterium]|jgi:mono/diheme cytochrome c family protein|nr:cytochrome c [Bryobacteraceae bacterium]
MKTIAIAFIAVSGLAFAGAPEGKTVFDSRCQACHGPNGEGKAAIAKLFKVDLPQLGSAKVQSMTDAELKKVITVGTGKMRPVSGLSDQQVDDVIAFVRTLKQ